MNRLRLGLLFPLVLVLTIMVPSRAGAQCAGAIANFASALELNGEGRTERPADFAITSGTVASQTCFVAGNSVRVTYNAILTNPTAVSNSTPSNFAITDAKGTLVVNVSTTTGIGASGPQTVIQVDVITGTTDAAASFTLTNLRFDVSTIAPTILGAANMNAFLSSTVPATTPTATGVGIVRNTINSLVAGTGVTTVGQGTQSAAGPLTTDAQLSFTDGGNGWGVNPFRVAITTPVVKTDIPTGATTLTFDVENIPSGVKVTFPATMTANPGATPVVFTATSGTLSATGGSLVVTYATTKAASAAFSLPISTGATASDFVAKNPPSIPNNIPVTIGVAIGSASGNGTATIRVVFGPSEAGQFTGDNASATAIPRYVGSILPGPAANRAIIASAAAKTAGSPVPFFVIAPTQSVLLYQYATDQAGYATGIAVSNTGNDSTIFGTTGQSGTVTFYLFQTGVTTPVIYTVKATNGRGLDPAGNLEPGNTFAISLDELLNDAGQGALVGKFSGYIMALCEFNYGHGFDIVFNQNGVGTAVNSLYLGSSARFDQPGQVGLSQ